MIKRPSVSVGAFLPGMSARLASVVSSALACALLLGCAHGRSDDDAASAPTFDAAAPTGSIVPPGEAPPEVQPTGDMEQMSFEEGVDAGPTEEIRAAPERKPIPPFKIFGTNGEGPG